MNYLKWLGVLLVLFTVGLGIGYYAGRKQTFTDIILEKCWLDKTTRDIVCISYIAD